MKNKLFSIFFGIALLMFAMPLVLGANALTLDYPVQDESVNSATYTLVGTLDTNTLNLTIGWFVLAFSNGTNVSLGAYEFNDSNTQFNVTFDSTAYDDFNNAVFWSIVKNETNIANRSDTSTGVDIDAGNPTATISSATFEHVVQGYTLKDSALVTAGVNADNTRGISSCRVIFTDIENGTVTDVATTQTANACSNTTISCNSVGVVGRAYNTVIQATDGNTDRTNSTPARRLNCASSNAVVSTGGAGGVSGVAQSFVGGGFGEAVSSGATSFVSGVKTFFSGINSFFKGLFGG